MAQQIPALPLNDSTSPTFIGTAFGGGFFAGKIVVGADLFALILSPAAGAVNGAWHLDRAAVSGTDSRCDGAANTKAMANAGSPLAIAVEELTINGYNDWYIPSCDELELIYRGFKPTDDSNYEGDGVNASSVPAGLAYTETSPAQTTVPTFKEGEENALEAGWYWSSTQYGPSSSYAWDQGFNGGDQFYYRKSYEGRARAVRRLKIQPFNNSGSSQPAELAPARVIPDTRGGFALYNDQGEYIGLSAPASGELRPSMVKTAAVRMAFSKELATMSMLCDLEYERSGTVSPETIAAIRRLHSEMGVA